MPSQTAGAHPLDSRDADDALRAFRREVERPAGQIDLGRAALVMARYAQPNLDVAHYVGKLDTLAEQIPASACSGSALARHLFDTLGYVGNTDDYADPRNSYLNAVVDRKLGIPITLSVLYLEIARRLGLRANGVGLPGHFIVRVEEDGGSTIFLDPFNRGVEMDEVACRARVRLVADMPFEPGFLDPVDSHYILTRMLNNLKNAHVASGDLPGAASVVERLLALNPGDGAELRNLGMLYAQTGRKQRAIGLLQRYLDRFKSIGQNESDEAAQVRVFLRALTQSVARWN